MPLLYVNLVVFTFASLGNGKVLLNVFEELYVVLTSIFPSNVFILISSSLIPGISSNTLTSLSVDVTSNNNSLSNEILDLFREYCILVALSSVTTFDLTFPNSFTCGLPSGPIIIEYPYTNEFTCRILPSS